MAGIGAFWSVSFLLVLVPGADWAYAITAGLRHRSVLPAVGGMLSGYVLLTAVVAAGLATAVAGSPTVLTALTAAGAAYLIWLGATTLARPAAPRAEEGDQGDGSGSLVGRAARGAGISGLNPKALLLFLALLPQFAARDADWPLPRRSSPSAWCTRPTAPWSTRASAPRHAGSWAPARPLPPRCPDSRAPR